MVTGGERLGCVGEAGVGLKACTCDEHQVLYGNVESLHCTPETNITLHVN